MYHNINKNNMNNNENNHSIHEFDYSLICEYFSSIDRQGPGSDASTLQALSFINPLIPKARIADLGCGTGSSAILLAKVTDAEVVALDLFPDFLDKLTRRAAKEGVADRIHPTVGSMDALPFEKESFDVIWSEGAIYNIGFERGLREWHKYVKSGGYVAISEVVWLTDERPDEIEQFWQDAYAEIDTIGNKVAQIQRCGYRLVAAFVLSDDCWVINYYIPQRQAQEVFLNKYPDNEVAANLVANQRHEAEIYNKYKAHYGYVFFIAQKV